MNKYYIYIIRLIFICIFFLHLVTVRIVYYPIKLYRYLPTRPSNIFLLLKWLLSRLFYETYTMRLIKTQTKTLSQTNIVKLENVPKPACPVADRISLTHLVKKIQYD